MQPAWYFMTVIMPFFFTFCISLVLIQNKALKWYVIEIADDSIYQKKKELICLYGVYIMGAACSIQCFLCHISNNLPSWYCYYGMSACCIMYAATKAFLYGFFLERAKLVQSANKLFPKFASDYVLPIYIALYFMVYVVLCPISFRGIDNNPIKTISIPTACLFGEYEEAVFYFSAIVDCFNSILFLFLFLYPLYDAVKRKENFNDSVDAQNLRKGLIISMKYNAIFSGMCMMSSVTFLIIMAIGNSTTSIGYYLWLGGDIDNFVNCSCTFMMVAANRKYICHIYSEYFAKYVQAKRIELDLAQIQSGSSKPQPTKITKKQKAKTLEAVNNNSNSTTASTTKQDDIEIVFDDKL